MKRRWLLISISIILFLVTSLSLTNLKVDGSTQVAFSRTYPNSVTNCMIATNDSGYALAGTLHNQQGGDFWLLKTDPSGFTQWNATYGDRNSEQVTALIQTIDGGFFLIGDTSSNQGDIMLVKTDQYGQQLWAKIFGTEGNDYANAAVQTSDGGYVVAGSTNWNSAIGQISDGSFYWLIKTDVQGKELWNRTYAYTQKSGELNYPRSMIETIDEGYLVGGYTQSDPSPESIWLVKTDPEGNMIWNRNYGLGELSSIISTSEGGFAFISHHEGVFLYKLDSEGSIQWNQTFTELPGNTTTAMIQTKDGGFAFTGQVPYVRQSGQSQFVSYAPGYPYFATTESFGNIQAVQVYLGLSGYEANAILQANDGSYVISGTIRFSYSPNFAWLTKTNIDGTLPFPVQGAENSWTMLAPLPSPRGYTGAVAANDKIYAIGGVNAGGIDQPPAQGLKRNEEYSPSTNTWTEKASMPTGRYSLAITEYQGKVYCIGGLANKTMFGTDLALGTNEIYDPRTDTWTDAAPLPNPIAGASANSANDKIYVIGEGLNQVYDPAKNSWTTGSPPPNSLGLGFGSAVVDDKIYVITLNSTQIYNPKTDTWNTGSAIPTNPMRGNDFSRTPIAATKGVDAPKKIYVLGEYSQAYDPQTDSWTSVSAMLVPQAYCGITVLNDTIFTVGGAYNPTDLPHSPFAPLQTTELFTPLGSKYATATPAPATPPPTGAPSSTTSPSQTGTTTPLSKNPAILLSIVALIVAIVIVVAGISALKLRKKQTAKTDR